MLIYSLYESDIDYQLRLSEIRSEKMPVTMLSPGKEAVVVLVGLRI